MEVGSDSEFTNRWVPNLDGGPSLRRGVEVALPADSRQERPGTAGAGVGMAALAAAGKDLPRARKPGAAADQQRHVLGPQLPLHLVGHQSTEGSSRQLARTGLDMPQLDSFALSASGKFDRRYLASPDVVRHCAATGQWTGGVPPVTARDTSHRDPEPTYPKQTVGFQRVPNKARRPAARCYTFRDGPHLP